MIASAVISRVTGPLLAKELRVAGRRRWCYLLRFAYVAGLTGLIVLRWEPLAAGLSGEGARLIARMAQAGKDLAAMIVWYQFVAMHVLTAAVLCGAMSEEVRRRTLGVMMTTPMSGWQIVFGKLASGLLGMMALLGCSLPVLAMITLFGGVPFEFMLASVCVTFTAMVLCGSLTLACCAFSRGGVVLVVVLYGAASIVWAMAVAVAGGLPISLPGIALLHAHPAAMLSTLTRSMRDPSYATGVWISWPAHCAVTLAIGGAVLYVAAARARQAGLRSLFQPIDHGGPPRPPAAAALRGVRGAIDRVYGSPLIWKELRYYLPESRVAVVVGVALTMSVLGLSYVVSVGADPESPLVHMFYPVLYLGAGVLTTSSLAGHAISTERRSRALPLLLTLPYSDNHLIFAKGLGVFYRAAPAWGLLLVHVMGFTLVGMLHPIALVHTMLALPAIVLLLVGGGLYLSSRSYNGKLAGALNMLMAAGLWVGAPVAVQALDVGTIRGLGLAGLVAKANLPARLVRVLGEAASARSGFRLHSQDAAWAADPPMSYVTETLDLAMWALMAAGVGLLLLWRARRRLRTTAW